MVRSVKVMGLVMLSPPQEITFAKIIEMSTQSMA